MASTASRNRFSELLQHLLTLSNTKNITLAKELQYDESYISKWVSGKMLPPEKNFEKILHGISNCIVNSLDEETSLSFLRQYNLHNSSQLNQAIYDDLFEEYVYVKKLKVETGSEIAPVSSYYPELTLTQFISKLHHPSLRHISSLEVVALMDVLALNNDYRLSISTFQNEHAVDNYYPGVEFTSIVHLPDNPDTYFDDAVFFIRMLNNLNTVNFNLYSNPCAQGKILFSVKNTFSISGMLLDSNHCLSVNVSEEMETCNTLYYRMNSLCTSDMLLFRKTSIPDMIERHEYTRSMLSSNLRCILGHLTEHFMPEDLHREILEQHYTNPDEIEQLIQLHQINRKVAKQSPIRVLVYESAIADFAISGQLDFYNQHIQLSPKQRMAYMQHLLETFSELDNVESFLITSNNPADPAYIAKATLFLSSAVSYLRLEKQRESDTTLILNQQNIKTVFSNFFDILWNKQNNNQKLIQCIQDSIHSIKILSDL